MKAIVSSVMVLTVVCGMTEHAIGCCISPIDLTPLKKETGVLKEISSHFNILNSQRVRAMYLRCAGGLGDSHSIRSLSNRREVCLRHSSSEEVPFVIR